MSRDAASAVFAELGYGAISAVVELRVLKSRVHLTSSVDVPCASCGKVDDAAMVFCDLCGRGYHGEDEGSFCCTRCSKKPRV